MPNSKPTIAVDGIRRPEYLLNTVKRFQGAAKDCAAATIVLAFATTQYCREVAEGHHGKLPKGARAKSVVTKILGELVGDKALASRLFDIDALASRLQQNNVRLDSVGISVQGVLYALVSAAKRAGDDRLHELVQDASCMTIKEFRSRWNPTTRNTRGEASRKQGVMLETVLNWLGAADVDDVRRVHAVAERLLRATAAA